MEVPKKAILALKKSCVNIFPFTPMKERANGVMDYKYYILPRNVLTSAWDGH